MTKLYTLTEEHRAQLRPWADKWIANAMSCKAMDSADRDAMRTAINGMYDAAGLPRPLNIVFVPSPLVGRIASGFAAAIWWLRDNGATRATIDATDDATSAATIDATSAATRAATIATIATIATRATRDDIATRADIAVTRATRAATSAATIDATSAATRDATRDATDADIDATDATHDLGIGWGRRVARAIAPAYVDLLCECAQRSWRFANAGNHWSGWVAYISFFRHVAKLDLPIYEKWQHYENAAIHGSWRWMHAKFCIVSDRPEVIRVDEAHRPHCTDGPSQRWRDGWELHHWHGLRIPAWFIKNKQRITPDLIDAEPNAELRRVMMEIFGYEAYVAARGAKIIASDVCLGHPRELLEFTLGDEAIRVVRVENGSLEPDGSRRRFTIPVPLGCSTPHEAVAWSYGRPANRYKEAVRT